MISKQRCEAGCVATDSLMRNENKSSKVGPLVPQEFSVIPYSLSEEGSSGGLLTFLGPGTRVQMEAHLSHD